MQEVPHVYVNRRGPDPGNDVVMDEAGAVRLFLDHVASLGHRSVVLIDGPRDVDTVHRRVNAARRYGASQGLQVTIRHAPATEEGRLGHHRAHAAHRAAARPPAGSAASTSCSACSPRCAPPAPRCPADISVVSFDEDECLAFLDVPVTSVCMPLAELGGAAVDALVARIEGRAAADVLVHEPMFLVRRASVAPPPDHVRQWSPRH